MKLKPYESIAARSNKHARKHEPNKHAGKQPKATKHKNRERRKKKKKKKKRNYSIPVVTDDETQLLSASMR